MKKFLKIILYLFIIGLVIGFCVYLYVFHKPHRNLANEDAAFTVQATELLNEFSTNDSISNKKYGDKAIAVKGIIVDIKKTNEVSVVLADEMTGVSCNFEAEYYTENKENLDKLKIGDEVTIKGKCDGYDPIMGVVLTRCVLDIK